MDSLELVREDSDASMLREAVDEELSVLGEAAKAIVYRKLERDFLIKSLDIPQKFKEFSSALGEILGPGSDVLIRFIVNRFHRKVGKPTSLSIDPSEIAQSIAIPQKQAGREFVIPESTREIRLKGIPNLTKIDSQ